MNKDLRDKLKLGLHLLKIDKGYKVKYDSIRDMICIEFPTCSIEVYESNYGYKQECDIRFKGFEISMPITLIDNFIDSKNRIMELSNVDDIFEILQKYIDDILVPNSIPAWYLNYVGWNNFHHSVFSIIYSLKKSDPLKVKYLDKDASWKDDFKDRYPELNRPENEYYWSIV